MNDVFLKGLSSSQVSDWLGQNSYGDIRVPARTGRVAPTSLQYLVIGGGGGGGTGPGGGGGSGGYRCSVPGETNGGGGSAESEIPVFPGRRFVIVVGAGGSGETPSEHPDFAKNGSDSYFGGIVSYGGGAGSIGFYKSQVTIYSNGTFGGCGGGAGAPYYGAAGGGLAYNNPTQGYAGGNSQGNNNYCGGGGGGAGAVGIAGTVGVTSRGGGGAGLSSAITGTSITRGGGGGGGSAIPVVSTVGGSGGGGNGNSIANGNGSNGTINTGGGGGGGGYNFPTVTAVGGNGGKGIVIIRYPSSASLAASTTGSPTQTTTGGYHIYVFNDSGSITF